MKDWIIGFGLLTAAALSWLWVTTAQANENNMAMKGCLVINGYTPENFDTFEWNKAAGCYQNWKVEKNKQELAELRDFLKHNPRYRYPGQSNNKCFGKPREMPFESAYIERVGDGFKAGVTYKDKLEANCYETAPWDNRDVKN
jgi:hypothetical protein